MYLVSHGDNKRQTAEFSVNILDTESVQKLTRNDWGWGKQDRQTGIPRASVKPMASGFTTSFFKVDVRASEGFIFVFVCWFDGIMGNQLKNSKRR